MNAFDLLDGDRFGYSVAVSGEIAVVGKSLESCEQGEFCGAAYVYRFDGIEWNQEAKLTPDRPSAGYFGAAVSIDNDWLVVGSAFGDCDEHISSPCGALYVYRYTESQWVFQQRLIVPDVFEYSLGEAVSISAQTIVAGARFGECPGKLCSGAAHVWSLVGTSWEYRQKLEIQDVEAFGQAVSVSEEGILIGAIGTDCSLGPDCGSAYFYKLTDGIWNLKQNFTATEASSNDIFGWSVSQSGDMAIISAPGERNCGGNGRTGAAYLFKKQGDGWVQQEQLCDTQPPAGYSAFGSAVALQGNRALVSAPHYKCGGWFECGAVFSFVSEGKSWILEQTIINPVPVQGGGLLGSSVAASEDKAFVGVTNYACCGRAYVFDLGPDCDENGQSDFCDIQDGDADDGNANGVPDECDVTASLDIEPGKCPNRMKSRERGNVKAALAGSDAFDVTEVDAASLELRRADGVGGPVSPMQRSENSAISDGDRLGRSLALPREDRVRIRDVATFDADGSCECGDDARDGFDDLILKFDARDLIKASTWIPNRPERPSPSPSAVPCSTAPPSKQPTASSSTDATTLRLCQDGDGRPHRGLGSKPRVAAQRLPWVRDSQIPQTHRGRGHLNSCFTLIAFSQPNSRAAHVLFS